MEENNRLGVTPLPKLMLQMAVPAVVAQIINVLYNIVDRIYIGHIQGVGSAALTGVGVTFPIITMITAFSNIVGSGGAPLSAIWMGKGDKEYAGKIMGTGVAMLLFFAACLMAVFYIFKVPFLYLFGASDATIGYGNSYLSIYLGGTVFVLLALGLNPYIIAQGKPKAAMGSVLLGAALNIALDPLFIFVFGWGVAGAAIATVISQFFSALWVILFLTGKKADLALKWSGIRMDFRIIRRIAALGVAPFVMMFTDSLMSIILNRGLQIYGGDPYVGSLTIMQSVMQLYTVPLNGFTQGIQPIISFNYGRGDFGRVKKTYRAMIGLSFCLMFGVALAAVLFPEPLAKIFTTDQELIRLVGKVMPVFMFGMLFFGLQNGIQPTFVGLGQAKLSLAIAILRKIVLLIPLALILPLHFGVMGVYYAEPISDILSVTVAVILFLTNIRKILSQESLGKIRQ